MFWSLTLKSIVFSKIKQLQNYLYLAAQFHGIPFYVAAPTTSIDFTCKSGKDITIEERPPQELTHIQHQPIAAAGINCWNPAFDVTPASLITGGIVTEFGVFEAKQLQENLKDLVTRIDH